jgi:hypothetical protein
LLADKEISLTENNAGWSAGYKFLAFFHPVKQMPNSSQPSSLGFNKFPDNGLVELDWRLYPERRDLRSHTAARKKSREECGLKAENETRSHADMILCVVKHAGTHPIHLGNARGHEFVHVNIHAAPPRAFADGIVNGARRPNPPYQRAPRNPQ